MKIFRNEWKFEYETAEIPALISRLSAILERDSNGTNGTYHVSSLYFDDYYDTCARDTEAGLSKRFKYRIRYYDKAGSLHLERKEKERGMCHKISCPLTLDEYNAILNYDTDTLLWKTNKQLLKRFVKDMITKQFKPKAIIDYDRIAFLYQPLNIRITVDQNISASNEFDKFLKGNYIHYPLQKINLNILEIKYDYLLPGYIKNLASNPNMLRQTYSKYYMGRLVLKEVGI